MKVLLKSNLLFRWCIRWEFSRIHTFKNRVSIIVSGLPFLGNVLSLDSKKPYPQFTKWGQEFNGLFTINLMGTNIVVVSSLRLIQVRYWVNGNWIKTISCSYEYYWEGDLPVETCSERIKHSIGIFMLYMVVLGGIVI